MSTRVPELPLLVFHHHRYLNFILEENSLRLAYCFKSIISLLNNILNGMCVCVRARAFVHSIELIRRLKTNF